MAPCGESFLKETHAGKLAKLLSPITVKKFGAVFWKADSNLYTLEIISVGEDSGVQVVGEGIWNFDSEVTCFITDKDAKVI